MREAGDIEIQNYVPESELRPKMRARSAQIINQIEAISMLNETETQKDTKGRNQYATERTKPKV
jgi:hypothetical protein